MKNCPNCGAQNMDADTFCKSCGTPLDTSAHANGKKSPKRDIFVDQSEEIVSTIGSNYLQNFLNGGKAERGVGVLTQKRFYYNGHNFTGAGKDSKSNTEEGVVSIDDITHTMFRHTRKVGLLVAACVLAAIAVVIALVGLIDGHNDAITFMICAAPVLLAAVIFLIRYFVSRVTLFQISFPGGSFGFDVKYYPIADVRDFQRQLHLLKDQIKNA